MDTTETGSDEEMIAAIAEIRPEQEDPLARSIGRAVRRSLVGASAEPFRLGRFTILELIGGGGMGTVFVAYDPDLDRKVALKVLRVRGEAGRSAMLREGRALARLTHPRIVTVHEVGVVEGQVFVVMEYVPGANLRDWLRSEPSAEAILAVLAEAADGLAAAHDAGLVHLDLKPENLLVDTEGHARVIDFGVARRLEGHTHDEPSSRSVTPSVPSGTPAYMAPERQRGDLGDHRADQYSLCVVAWEALLGERPLGPGAPTPVPVPVPGRVVDALRRGLQPDPEARFASMHALADALASPLAAPPPSRRGRWAGGLVLAGLLVGAYVFGQHRATTPSCPSPWPRIELTWNPDHAAAVEAAFRGTSAPFVEGTWGTVDNGLDRYAVAWTEAEARACDAGRDGSPRARAERDQRLACLEDRRLHLEALVERFEGADVGVVTRAVEGLEGLPAIDGCEQPNGADASLSGDPSTVAARAEIRRAIARLRTALAVGSHDGIEAEVEDTLARAEALGHPLLQVEALLLAVELGHHQGPDRRERSLARAREALRLATLHAEPLLVAHALLAIVQLRHGTRDATSNEELLGLAEALCERLGDPIGLRSTVLLTRATELIEQERCSEAAAGLEDALAELGEDVDRRWVIAALLDLANCDNTLGEFARAEQVLRRALAIAEPMLGEGHPWFAVIHNGLGNATAGQGRLEASLTHYGQVESIARANFGPDHPMVAVAQSNRATTYGELGRHEEALRAQRAALASYERTHGPDHFETAFARCKEASVRLPLQRPQEALAAAGRALVILDAQPEVDCSILWCHAVHGRALVELDRASEAVAELEAPLASVMERECPPSVRGDLLVVMARARWHAQGERARAEVLALLDRAERLGNTVRAEVDVVRAEVLAGSSLAPP